MLMEKVLTHCMAVADSKCDNVVDMPLLGADTINNLLFVLVKQKCETKTHRETGHQINIVQPKD